MTSITALDIEDVAAVVAKAIDDATEPLEKRIAALEGRKSTSGVLWAGVHERGKQYAAGSLCTVDGSLWLAVDATDERPGGSLSWRLIVKGDRRER